MAKIRKPRKKVVKPAPAPSVINYDKMLEAENEIVRKIVNTK